MDGEVHCVQENSNENNFNITMYTKYIAYENCVSTINELIVLCN